MEMSLRSDIVVGLSDDTLKQLRLFRRQYLQLLDLQHLRWPADEHLRRGQVQEWLYEHCFSGDGFLPPERYQLRVLKQLMGRIERAVVDPEEDEISDNLMTLLSDLMFAPLPDETKAAQQKAWVSYTLSSSHAGSDTRESALRLLENRSVISGGGTTGLRTWEAALHLASYFLSSPQASSLVTGKTVLELGAGTGLLSLLCAGPLKAQRVIATDGDQGVVQALEENATCNELFADTKFAQLWWGRSLKGSWLEQSISPGICDVVVGADVTYDKAVIPALVSTIRDVFELWPKAQLIISATIRNQDTFSAFELACVHNEFAVTRLEYPLVPMSEQTLLFHSALVPIKILLITAPASQKDPYSI